MALMNPSLGEPDGGDAEYEAAVASGDLQKLFSVLEREQGLPAGYLRKTAQIESRMNPAAKNPRSSAGGLFQQLDSNARQYGVQDKFDPVQSALGAAMFAGDNADVLMRTLGREPTAGELYLAHQQGAGGATKLLSNPNAPASSIVGDAAARLNGGAGKTAGQLAKTWTSKLDGAADLPATDAIPVSMDTGEKGFAVPGAGLMNRTAEAYQPAKQDNLLRNAVMALGQSIASGKRGDYTGGFSTSLNALQASDEKRDDRRYDIWRDQRNFGQTVAESQRAQGNTDRNFDLQKTNNDLAQKREARSDELERERVNLARNADTRAADAANAPDRKINPDGTVTEIDKDGAVSIKGTPNPSLKPLPQPMVKSFNEAGKTVEDTRRFTGTFSDDYAGYGVKGFGGGVLGEAANMAGRNLPGSSYQAQAQWWQDYATHRNQIRNNLFGAALTPGEKAEFDKTDISPGMSAEAIRKNLQRQQELAENAARRAIQPHITLGVNAEAVEGAVGVPLDSLGVKMRPPKAGAPSSSGVMPITAPPQAKPAGSLAPASSSPAAGPTRAELEAEARRRGLIQ